MKKSNILGFALILAGILAMASFAGLALENSGKVIILLKAGDGQSISPDSSLAPLYHNIGVLQFYSGNEENAIDLFKAAIALDPGYEKAYKSLALAEYHSGNLINAIAYQERLIELSPTSSEAQWDLAVMLVENFRNAENNGMLTPEHIGLLSQARQLYLAVYAADSRNSQAMLTAEVISGVLHDYGQDSY